MITYDQVYKLATELSVPDQVRLIAQLQEKVNLGFVSVTRDQLMFAFEQKRQSGVFASSDNLHGEYANAETDISEADLLATIRLARDQWKEDFPEEHDN